jgi:hypothetical protein
VLQRRSKKQLLEQLISMMESGETVTKVRIAYPKDYSAFYSIKAL